MGTITAIGDQEVTLLIHGFGLAVHVPRTAQLGLGKSTTLFTYLHWNAENGPSLYGFPEELERTVFELIISCPKIGPKLGLAVLANLSAPQFIDAISAQHEKILSSISGVGPKKAEQLILGLKHKVAKLLSSGELRLPTGGTGASDWHTLNEALVSLGYSKSEINNALANLKNTSSEQQLTFDQLLRAALSHLSKSF